MKEAKFKSGFIDFNGILTTDRIYNGQEAHGEVLMADEIFSLLQKKNIEGDSLVQAQQERYEEYTEEYIQNRHKDKGCTCEIIRGERELLVENGEDSTYINNYTINIPLRIIIQQFIATFPDHIHTTITEKNKKELAALLQDHQTNRANRPYISDEVFILSLGTGDIYDMGC